MKVIKKATICTMSLLVSLACMSFLNTDKVFASLDEQNEQGNEPLSNLEKEGLFPAVKEDGSVDYIKVENEDRSEELKLPEETDSSTTFDLKLVNKEGEAHDLKSFDTFEEANAAMMRQSLFRSGDTSPAVYTNGRVRSVTNGVVNFRTKSCGTYINYTEDGTSVSGGINGCYGADAAYLGTNSDGTKVKFKMAGVTGWVSASDVEILNYDTSAVQSVEYYKVRNGRIIHFITTNISSANYASSVDVGPKQSYMQEGKAYYSYDGHYFYDSYAQMIVDYKNNTYKTAINAGNPYYNYYQYLSFRSKANLTASDFNSHIASQVGAASALYNQGSAYIKHQNTYGANAALVMGVSINESGWGLSNYAKNRNNIFGIGAYDSDPDHANSFPSVSECIRQYDQSLVSITYLDPIDVSGLYHGPCLGDKSIGMGVKYATAPYWGETNAHFANLLAQRSNSNDYGKYTIGIKNNDDSITIRKEPNTSSTALYKTGAYNNFPFVILDTVTGQSINGTTKWYKIATDAPLSNDRSKALQFRVNQGGEYNASISYAYVSASYVDIINDGQIDGGNDGDSGNSGEPYRKGDVNGDGKISTIDYIYVKNQILKISTLSGNAKNAADVNNDGKISTYDYIMIKNNILGISKIK